MDVKTKAMGYATYLLLISPIVGTNWISEIEGKEAGGLILLLPPCWIIFSWLSTKGRTLFYTATIPASLKCRGGKKSLTLTRSEALNYSLLTSLNPAHPFVNIPFINFPCEKYLSTEF